jgi:hypothetical protein
MLPTKNKILDGIEIRWGEARVRRPENVIGDDTSLHTGAWQDLKTRDCHPEKPPCQGARENRDGHNRPICIVDTDISDIFNVFVQKNNKKGAEKWVSILKKKRELAVCSR